MALLETAAGGRLVRALTVLCLTWAGSSACASATSNVPGSAAQVQVATIAGQVDLLDSEVNVDLVAPRDSVWQVVVGAHREIGLPAEPHEMDEAGGAIEVTRRFDRGLFGGESLEAFVICAEDLRRSSVNYSEVELTVLSRVRPRQGGQVQVGTRVGGAVRMGGAASQNWAVCRSTGVLENRILGAVRSEIAPESLPIVAGVERVAEVNGSGGGAGAVRPSARTGYAGATAAPEIRDAIADVPVGDQIRIYVENPWERIAGAVLGKQDRIVEIREGMRPRRISLSEITRVQIRRERRSLTFPFALAGAGVGALVFAVTDVGISGNKSEQGEALNPFLGAVIGSIPGGVVGALLGGDFWETVARAPGR